MNNLKRIYAAVAALCVATCFVAVNSWSLWLDESSTAFLASLPTVGSLMETMHVWHGSEVQMPGYVAAMFGWEKVFGHSEYALRSFNLFMMALMLGYLYTLVARKAVDDSEKHRIVVYVLLTTFSSFVMYNMNEARVNISLFVLGTVTLSSMKAYCSERKPADLYVLLASVVTGFTFNMLYFIVAVPVLLMIGKDYPRMLHEQWKHLMVPVMLLGLAATYYIASLISGDGGMKERPGVINIAYSLYEFCGFNGLGIPKNDMRGVANIIKKVQPYIPTLLLGLAAYTVLLSGVVKCRIRNRAMTVMSVSMLVFVIIAYMAGFRFWGRHLLMLYPIFLYMVADVLCRLWKYKAWRTAVLAFVMVMMLSCTRVMLADCYKKEDVKKAIATANEMVAGNPVYFFGFPKLADYYGLRNYLIDEQLGEGDSGLLLYIHSMNVYYEKIYRGMNPLKDAAHFKTKVVWTSRDATLYRFEPKKNG